MGMYYDKKSKTMIDENENKIEEKYYYVTLISEWKFKKEKFNSQLEANNYILKKFFNGEETWTSHIKVLEKGHKIIDVK
tara:strand:+ start:1276 stop:1512 length:237 start_codon:yes stop_codon:yes gene_type:complete